MGLGAPLNFSTRRNSGVVNFPALSPECFDLESTSHDRQRLRFGLFEADLVSRELYKRGHLVHLQEQPFRILAMLLEQPGEVISREQVQKKLWTKGTFVDFDEGLDTALKKLRQALGDSPQNPIFVETIPRRGYRFIAPVNGVKPASAWKQPATGKIMLAVLPFDNLSGDREQEYFSDGLTEEMINQLGRLRPERLGVIARTSAMNYKHASKGIDQIGRELGVDYVLEGGVRCAGERLRITAQLIQVTDQTHFWAESYERDLSDALVLQSEVALAIASEINVKLTPQQRTRLVNTRPLIPAAYEAYLKGRYSWNRRSEEGFKKSIEYFNQAIGKDPIYALAYTGLADGYIELAEYSLVPPKEGLPRAREAATIALELDDSLAEAHTSLAAVKELYEWDFGSAETGYRRALGLSSGYATAHQWYAELLSRLGRHEEALAEIRRAQELDPVSLIIDGLVGELLLQAGQEDEAIERLKKTLELDPNFGWGHGALGNVFLRKAKFGEAIAEYQNAMRLTPNINEFAGALGNAFARGGQRAKAQELLDELREQSKRRYVSWVDIAPVCAGLGDKDQAFFSLQRAYDQHDTKLIRVNVEPRFDSLRADPRFSDLLHRIGLPP
jgi:TolB-like protein/Flp pilus assembly protein TadD